MIVGVIADTHGLLRPEVVRALQGCEHIIHAGDVGSPNILELLRTFAPVSAIRGNIDRGPLAKLLPETELLTLAGHDIFVLHDLKRLALDPRAASLSAIISGHTHTPHQEMKDGVLYLNPGSVGPRRFNLPISMAKLTLQDATVKAEFLEFDF